MNEVSTKPKLIDAALAHLALERAAACVLPVPETDPPLFVAVGPGPAIVKLLQAEVDLDSAADAGDIAGHARALRRKALAQQEVQQDAAPRALRTAKDALHFLALNPELKNPHEVAQGALKAVERAERGSRAKAALQELADIAQENDMGDGAPKKVAADVEFDESEGGHHD